MTTTPTTALAPAPFIATSHRRSEQYGLRPGDRPDDGPLSGPRLTDVVERSRLLYSHALPAMEALYQQIANTHHMVLLTDAQGVILHSLGDADFLEKAGRVALAPGVAWSEQRRGTNAIGTAIAERSPAVVHADQHFLAANHFLTCSAAPIGDHHGNVVGVLDVSGDRRGFHHHTLGLVRMSAQMIENGLFAAAFDDAITLRFHARPEFVGTLMEGIASFAPDGRFLAANRNGLFQLGLAQAALRTHTLASLFGLTVGALADHCRGAAPGLLDLYLHNGVRVRARAEVRGRHAVHVERPAPARPSSLRALDTGDARLAQALDKVARVLGRGVAILVTGETGTGKELLARAIHADSPRAGGPFVAVNCASIPETLVESELFGYEEGAFTGARKKGATGRIAQAHGGTLFLDEIGDMPPALQARLLRVLQERTVTPLGGGKPVPVDVELVCATHRDLRQRIADGLFRADLYYRLNGLVVHLPPLRERTDLEAVATRLLAAEGPHRLADDVLALFRRHPWPGNLRQLATLLRTAAIIAGDEPAIGLRHLPDDFLADAEPAPLPAAAPAAPAPAPAAAPLDDVERLAIRQALDAHGGNVSAAARALGVSRNTIYRRVGQART